MNIIDKRYKVNVGIIIIKMFLFFNDTATH